MIGFPIHLLNQMVETLTMNQIVDTLVQTLEGLVALNRLLHFHTSLPTSGREVQKGDGGLTVKSHRTVILLVRDVAANDEGLAASSTTLGGPALLDDVREDDVVLVNRHTIQPEVDGPS